MIISMILAHLVGDYVLQWDRLAMWKGKALSGVLAHGLVVTLVTIAFILPFNPLWWQGALIISVIHILIDVIQLPITRQPIHNGTFALFRFILDQMAHFAVIGATLIWGGFLTIDTVWIDIVGEASTYPFLVYLAAYTVLAMPTWVLLEFVMYGLIAGSPPDFRHATNKYVSSLERWLITTSVLLGQFILVPIIAAPRLLFERTIVAERQESNLYLAKMLASVGVAILIGLGLRYLFRYNSFCAFVTSTSHLSHRFLFSKEKFHGSPRKFGTFATHA